METPDDGPERNPGIRKYYKYYRCCLGGAAVGTYRPDNQLTEALARVGLLEEIKKTGGLDAIVGEGGQGLSGGQKQCLVLARILLRPARLIILDEATSALDNITEELVMHTLEASGKTIIAIAHRLSTLRNADRIIVMKEGRIYEQGTYAELDRRGGFFHDLLHAGENSDSAP